MADLTPPNKLRRTCIVVGSLVVSLIGLIYLNMLPQEDITLINQRTAEGLMSIFMTVFGFYLVGSVTPSAIRAFKGNASHGLGDVQKVVDDNIKG